MQKKRLLTDRSGELQEQIIAEQSKVLASEIDAQLMRSMYQELGWHEVILTPIDWEQCYHIDTWVEDNIKGAIWTHGLVWMFEKDRDAMWFKLRWLNGL
jgi:hypothetical protein